MNLNNSLKVTKRGTVKKIYPTAEECKVNNLVKCTEEGCQSVFKSESNLMLHLAKTHKKPYLIEADASSKQYFCPELGCFYNKRKYFRNLKSLRQHYLKVHSKKDYQCTVCQKNFVTENVLRNHIEYCGISFDCCECQASYLSYETLKTHGRRKKHNILSKPEYKLKITMSKSEDVITTPKKSRLLLPKKCVSLLVFSGANKATINQESQTEKEEDKPELRSKMTQVNRNMTGLQNTQHTQTGSKYIQLAAETQTIGDYLNINSKNITDVITDTGKVRSSITQTEIVESRSTSCNTSFNLEDFEFIVKPDVKKTSFGTQTTNAEFSNIYSTSTTTHDSIHTDTSDLLTDTLNDSISSEMSHFEFYNCNTETQTDFLLDEEMFNCDYMSNMYTQTCDILNDLGFSDIQTQTVFDDVLRSVESQTLMSHAKKNVVSRDMSNMETQTDTEFRQMLEVINS